LQSALRDDATAVLRQSRIGMEIALCGLLQLVSFAEFRAREEGMSREERRA